jgi:hypothetical protein
MPSLERSLIPIAPASRSTIFKESLREVLQQTADEDRKQT